MPVTRFAGTSSTGEPAGRHRRGQPRTRRRPTSRRRRMRRARPDAGLPGRVRPGAGAQRRSHAMPTQTRKAASAAPPGHGAPQRPRSGPERRRGVRQPAAATRDRHAPHRRRTSPRTAAARRSTARSAAAHPRPGQRQQRGHGAMDAQGLPEKRRQGRAQRPGAAQHNPLTACPRAVRPLSSRSNASISARSRLLTCPSRRAASTSALIRMRIRSFSKPPCVAFWLCAAA